MSAILTTDATAIAKEYYESGAFIDAAYVKNPGMALATKKAIKGKYLDFAYQYGQASNRSRTAANALAKTNKTNFLNFNVPTVASYDAKDIDQKAIAEITDEGAFVDLLTNTMDNISKAIGNGLGEDLYNDIGGSLGVVGAVVTTLLTLANPSHVTRFYFGQSISSSSADGNSGALDAGSVVISQIDRDAGTLTAAANWTAGIAAIAAGRFLFNTGDFGLGRAGLKAWCPDVTTGLGTAFYGAVRNVDVNRMAGSRQTVTTGADIVSSLRNLVARMGREEASPNNTLMSFEMLADLETQLETKVYIEVKAKDVDIGFSAVRVVVGGYRLDCVPDRSCGDDRIYVLNDEVLKLIYSQDDVVKLDDMDGEIVSRNASSFSYDIRGSSYSNYVVESPKEVGVLLFQ